MSSFFQSLDEVSEQPNKCTRGPHQDLPPSLKDSPYLSSPIRTLPSFNRQRSSNFSVSSKRSREKGSSVYVRSERPNSPAHSTLGSLRLASPYSDSIYSIHSLCTSTKQNTGKRQSLSRAVLLPHEIDNLAQELKIQFNNVVSTQEQHKETQDENEPYDLSDFDDDSTICSEFANSITDKNIFDAIKVSDDGEFKLFNNHKDDEGLPKEVSIHESPHSKKCDRKEETKAIKLPTVEIQNNISGFGGKTPKQMKQENAVPCNSSLEKSPYAQTRAKRKKKKDL